MNKVILILCISIIFKVYCQDYSASLTGGIVNYKLSIGKEVGKEIDLNVYYKYSNDLMLSLSTGFQNWNEPYGAGGNKLKSIPLLIGLRLLIPTDYFTPYFSGEVGLEFIKRKFTFEQYEITDLGLSRLISTEPRSDSGFGFISRVGVGISSPIYYNLDIDFGMRYSISNYEYVYIYTDDTSKKIRLCDLYLGIIYKFD